MHETTNENARLSSAPQRPEGIFVLPNLFYLTIFFDLKAICWMANFELANSMLLTFIHSCSTWLLVSHYISAANSTVLPVSLHRSHQRTVIKLRVGREWTALRQTNLSLLSICWPRHPLFFFLLTLYTDSPPPVTNTLVFLTPINDFQFSFISSGGIVRRTALCFF